MEKEDQNKFWELAAGKIHGENEPSEAVELDDLLKKQENSSSFKQLQNIHDKLHKAKPLTGVSRERSWGKINGYFRAKRARIFVSVTKYAAILLVAFLLGNIFRSVWTLGPETGQMAEITVPLGQMSEVTLYDGTHVWLNSGTTLQYTDKFGKKNRNISLDGEAFFKVTHSKIPFRVKLKNSEIEVLGTSFNAISYKNENISYVTLVEGSVNINSLSGEKITTIKPSQQITIPENLKDTKVNSVNASFYYSWTEGKIVFEEERLEDVAARLERWYNVEIRLEGQGTADLRFSGTVLKNKPLNQIVKAFDLLLPVSVNYQNNLQSKDVLIISKQDLPMKN
jgi:ferric-dicitrate binding protein FerR (iron transport regulator)